MIRTTQTVGVLLLGLLSDVHAFYLPGAVPTDFGVGDKVDLYVNALTPKTNVGNPKLVSHACIVTETHKFMLRTEISHKLCA
jgi:hypothetical protein